MGKRRYMERPVVSTARMGEVQRLDLEVLPSPNSLWVVREAVGDLSLPTPILDDVRLLVSELVTNSIRHSGIGPDDRIHVRARIGGGRLRVDVIDGGHGRSRPEPGGIRPTPGATSGWGLYLVETLTTRWGRGRGRYWFELDLDGT